MPGVFARVTVRRSIIVMGVAGCGKTTLGAALAGRLMRPFIDADDLHDAAARAKMAAGVALNVSDRAPWLARLNTALRATPDTVLACSALRAEYRDTLRAGMQQAPLFVYLHAPRDVIATRLASRAGHFFSPALLDSQFATLEPPADALTLDAAEPLAVLVERVATVAG
jgi:carbohydrate kinase (thermoresistant glucokinase family)